MFNKLIKAACTMLVFSTVYNLGKAMACVEIAASEQETDDITQWDIDIGEPYANKALNGQKRIGDYFKNCFKF